MVISKETQRGKLFWNFFLKILFIFLERRGEGEREGEKHQCVVASHISPLGTWTTHNPGMCPDWESNWQPVCLLASTQSTEPYQPGPFLGDYKHSFPSYDSVDNF